MAAGVFKGPHWSLAQKPVKITSVLKDDCHIRIKAHDSDILSDFLIAKKS